MWRTALKDQPSAVGIRPRALAVDLADAGTADISLGPARSPLLPCPALGHGKRPTPVTRLTTPAAAAASRRPRGVAPPNGRPSCITAMAHGTPWRRQSSHPWPPLSGSTACCRDTRRSQPGPGPRPAARDRGTEIAAQHPERLIRGDLRAFRPDVLRLADHGAGDHFSTMRGRPAPARPDIPARAQEVRWTSRTSGPAAPPSGPSRRGPRSPASTGAR
jgi:hypothetical protein